jgi:hypothetical protein
MLGRVAPRLAAGAGRAWVGAATTAKPRWITTESRAAIDKLVKSNDIVVFMKGTPGLCIVSPPACAWSCVPFIPALHPPPVSPHRGGITSFARSRMISAVRACDAALRELLVAAGHKTWPYRLSACVRTRYSLLLQLIVHELPMHTHDCSCRASSLMGPRVCWCVVAPCQTRAKFAETRC